MPWLLPSWTELKKKVLRYLLNRYLGQFLEEKLTLDQLSVDFFKGTGTVKDVTLQSQVCSETLSVNMIIYSTTLTSAS